VAKVIKYGNVSQIETEFKPAPVGLYYAKVASVDQKKSKNDEQMVEVVFTLTKDANGKKLKQQYGQLWYYAPLDPEASWARRMKELVVAFGLKAKGGNIGVIEGKEAMLRLREDKDLNGDYRPNIGKVMAVKEPEEDEDEDEDEAEETNGRLDGLSRAELKKLIKEEGLEVTVKKSMSDDELREAISDQLEDEEDEDEEEPDDEEEEDDEEEDDEEPEDEEDNYDEMSLSALRQELTDRELETKGKKAVLIARLRTDDVEEPV
jgi:hypothetical protein